MADEAVIRFRINDPRFLAALTPAAAKAIVSGARPRQYMAKSVIVNQGHPAEHFFLLVSGRARYFYIPRDGRKVNLKWLAPGDIFSPAALLPTPSEYLLSTEAVKDCQVLVWNRAAIRNLIKQYPQLIDNLFSIAFDFFTFYRDAHTSLTCDSGPQRVAHVLANLAGSVGQSVAGGTEFDLFNEELADEANVDPFTVSRLLSDWQRKGILTKRRGKVVLHSPQQLFLEKGLA